MEIETVEPIAGGKRSRVTLSLEEAELNRLIAILESGEIAELAVDQADIRLGGRHYQWTKVEGEKRFKVELKGSGHSR